MKPTYIVALSILALALGVTLYSFSGTIAKHASVSEAKAHPGQTVQVPGKILHETVDYNATEGVLRFDIVDMANPVQRMTIAYRQPKPDNFDTATSVEAIGAVRNGVFEAHSLLVKCPSKYRDEKPRSGDSRGVR